MDARCGVRALHARPAFTLVAVATLALGIGANVAIFSVVDAIVLRALPYDNPDELVRFWPDALFSNGVGGFAELSDKAPEGIDLAAYGRTLATFTGGAEPEMVRGAVVSSNYFDTLGAHPLAGRGFVAGEGEPGRDRVLVLGYGFWQRRFGGDASLIGESVEIRGEPWRVVGVMGPEHQPLEPDWQFWRPLDPDPERDRGNALAVIGRLHEGIGPEQAGAYYRETLVARWQANGYDATA